MHSICIAIPHRICALNPHQVCSHCLKFVDNHTACDNYVTWLCNSCKKMVYVEASAVVMFGFPGNIVWTGKEKRSHEREGKKPGKEGIFSQMVRVQVILLQPARSCIVAMSYYSHPMLA